MTTTVTFFSSLICFFFAGILEISIVQAGAADPRSINIYNKSGSKVEIYWINPTTKEAVLQSDPFIYNGATFSLDSYVTHAFEAREMPGKSGKCSSSGKGSNNTCGVGYFTVNANSDQGKPRFFRCSTIE